MFLDNVRKNRTGPWELYDLAKDISEQKNLASEHPELIRQFDVILAREHRPSHLNEWEIMNPKTPVPATN